MKEATFIAIPVPNNMCTYESENKIHPSAEVIAAHNIFKCNDHFKLS
jgi:hypothetical protein